MAFLVSSVIDLRSGNVIAILSSIGDGISHSCKTRLVDQIYDQLHLMDTLKISISRIISSLNQSLETCLHQMHIHHRKELPAHRTGLSLSQFGK